MTVQRPYFEHGFWWWFNPDKGDWFVGPAPSISYPKWWKYDWKLERSK